MEKRREVNDFDSFEEADEKEHCDDDDIKACVVLDAGPVSGTR